MLCRREYLPKILEKFTIYFYGVENYDCSCLGYDAVHSFICRQKFGGTCRLHLFFDIRRRGNNDTASKARFGKLVST